MTARSARNEPIAATIVLCMLALTACGESTQHATRQRCTNAPACAANALPLEGASAGPTLTHAALDCQRGGGVVLEVTLEHASNAELSDVDQVARVFRRRACSDGGIELSDDVSGSGVEESFGTVVERETEPDLHGAICGCSHWPVAFQLRDRSGNQTSGVVSVQVVVPE